MRPRSLLSTVPTQCVQPHVLGRLCCQQPDALAAAGQQMCCAADSCLGGAGLGAVFWVGTSSTDPSGFVELLGDVALNIGRPGWAAAGGDEHAVPVACLHLRYPQQWNQQPWRMQTCQCAICCGWSTMLAFCSTVMLCGVRRRSALRPWQAAILLGDAQHCLASSCIGNAFRRVSKVLWMLYML